MVRERLRGAGRGGDRGGDTKLRQLGRRANADKNSGDEKNRAHLSGKVQAVKDGEAELSSGDKKLFRVIF